MVIERLWDLTPAGIIRDLDLLWPIYLGTATLGRFGSQRSPDIYPWERLSKVDSLRTEPNEQISK